MVPVVVSTALSTKVSVPSLACPPPTGSARTTSFSARCSWISDRFAAGTANRTRIGRIWLMVTSGVASLARTRFPSRTRRLPVRPAIGARMVAYWRLSRASVDSAWLAGQRGGGGRRGGTRLVVLLRGDVLLLGQLAVAGRFLAGVRRLRLVTLEDRLGLGQGRLEGPGIDLEEHLTLLDVLPLAECDPHDRPADLRLHRHRLERLHGAGGQELERHRAPLHRGEGDRDGR